MDAKSCAPSRTAPLQRINNIVVFIHGQHTVRGKALHGKGAGHAHFLVVRIGLVVQKLKVRLGGDGRVYFLLSGNAGCPPGGMEFLDSLDARPAVNRLSRNPLLCCAGQP